MTLILLLLHSGNEAGQNGYKVFHKILSVSSRNSIPSKDTAPPPPNTHTHAYNYIL